MSSTQGDRFNSNKPKISLIDPDFIIGLSTALTFGAKKYGVNNWKKGLYVTESMDSLQRHLMEFMKGNDSDEESKLLHIDHAIANLMFIRYFSNTIFDDRQIDKMESV